MTVNASARDYRIWVCKKDQDESTGLEVTDYCSGGSGGFFTASVQPMDESGIIHVSGQLTLVVPPHDETFNPWLNPTRWAIGNFLIVKVADQAGTLRRLPLSRLYIISEPKPPYPGNWTITVELGDKFTLLDSVKPSPISDGLVVSGVTSLKYSGPRGEVIDWLLSGATDLNYTGDLPGPSLIDYEPDRESPIVDQIGELAIGGFGCLYLDKDDNIKTVWLGTTPARRLFRYVDGVDDAGDFEPLQSPIRPASEVEVVSETTVIDDSEDAEESDASKYEGLKTTVDRMSAGSIDGSLSGSSTTVDTIGIVRKERWQWRGARYENVVEEQRARGLVIPEDLYELLEQQGRSVVAPGPLGLMNALVIEEQRIYESGPEGRLLSVRKETTKTRGEVLAEWYKKNLLPNASLPSFGEMFVCEIEETTYKYQRAGGEDSKGQVREIRTEIQQCKGQLAATANDWIIPGIAGPTTQAGVTDLVTAEIKVESWAKRSSEEWEKRTQHYQAGRAKSGSITAFTTLRQIKGETITARNGDLQPPAADRRPGTDEARERRISYIRRGKVFIEAETPRERKVLINHLPTQADVIELAELLAKIENYRHRGYRITTPLRDEWFYFWPLARVDLKIGDHVWWGATDALTITLAQSQAIVVADFMRVAQWPDVVSGEPDASYPYDPIEPLESSDPDPDPLVGTAFPDQTTQQPMIPVVAVKRPFDIQHEHRAVFTSFDYALGTVAGGTFTSRHSHRVKFSAGFVVQHEHRVLIEQVPRLDVRHQHRVAISEPAAAAPFAYWPLTNNPWTDDEGDRDLAAQDSTPLATGTYTEFGWDDGGFPDYGFLQTPDTYTWTRTSTANYSWRITFELYWSSTYGQFTVTVPEEFRITVSDSSLQVLVYTDFGADPDADASLSLSSPAAETWHTIDVRYDATTNTIDAYFNGGNSGLGGNSYTTPGETSPSQFRLTQETGITAGLRLKEVKFYRSTLVER